MILNSGLNGEWDPGVWRSGSRGLQAEGRVCEKGWRWTLAGHVLGMEVMSAWLGLSEGGESRGDSVRAVELGGLKVLSPAAGTQQVLCNGLLFLRAHLDTGNMSGMREEIRERALRAFPDP